jgi:hypothetical protein
MVVMFDMGAPELGYPRAMPFMFIGAQEDQTPVHESYNWIWGFDPGYVLTVESPSVYR